VAPVKIFVVWVMTPCRLAHGLCFRGACRLFMVIQEEIECLYRGRLVEGDASKEALGEGLLCCAVLWPSTIGGRGHTVAQLVEALRYKSEGCGFDSRWCHGNFSLT
jgi:hypothetical protein